ncbi:blue copper protein-like [Salvia miltiorrhiza]|uniref:blue copper protein-like n=1 Tax=Salvia miltiorrhiza TaxID=226208 RepID=UPI0025AC5A4E|nr:blue copper protein-like [Salvia miltiorrhiza]
MRMGKCIRCGIACLMIICGIEAAAAAVYTVGDSSGWSIGADYATWTTDKTFSVGDTLAFNYPPGHTVDEVSASDYKTCTIGNAIASDSSGATSVSLKTAGPHYYICGVPGHCGGGMKLAITVAAGAGNTTTLSPAPPAAVTTLAPPTGLAVPAGGTFTDPYSSSARLSVAAAAVFAFYALAIFNCFII